MRAVVGAVLLALLAALIGSPVAGVVARGAARAAARPAAWLLLADTLVMAAASTILAVGLGAVVAWAVTRTDVAGRGAVAVLGPLPLLAPLGVTALAVKVVAGDVGGFGVLVAVQAVTFLPHGFVLARDALAAVEPDLETAAISLGASGVSALTRITLPLAGRRLVGAVLAVFGLALGDFATPFLLGGDYRVLSTEIYRRAVVGQGAAPLATLLLLPALLASALAAPRGVARTAAAASSAPPRRATPPALRAALFVVVHGLVLVVAATYVAVFAGAVAGAGGAARPPSSGRCRSASPWPPLLQWR